MRAKNTQYIHNIQQKITSNEKKDLQKKHYLKTFQGAPYTSAGLP